MMYRNDPQNAEYAAQVEDMPELAVEENAGRVSIFVICYLLFGDLCRSRDHTGSGEYMGLY
jgi:hypothetical protein